MSTVKYTASALAAALFVGQMPAHADGPIPLIKVGNSYSMTAAVGSVPITFHLDTGADLVCLPNATADKLIRRGEATLTDSDVETLYADGNVMKTRRFMLRKLIVGEYQLTNVMAADGCSNALFGQSALLRFPS
jgi:predicted aspartyl protease